MLKNTLICLLLLAANVVAQVNVEDQRLERKKTGFSGSVSLSVELERGNSELTEIGFQPQFVYRYFSSQWFMLNSYSFVETRESSVINEGFSHLRYNYDLTPIVVLEALTQVQYNREQDLRDRILLGAGLRFELIKRAPFNLAIGVTGMYEYEELEASRDIIRTPRNSDYVAVRWRANERVSISNTVYVQPAFDDISDIRVLDNFALTAGLSNWLALTLAVEYRYDSEPPDGIREYDLSLKNGLTVKF